MWTAHGGQQHGMDPVFRRWWRLIDDLPEHLSVVHRWSDGPPPPLSGDGHLHVIPTSVVCLEGVVRISSPQRTIDLRPGEALMIGPGIWHRHDPLRRGSVWFGQGMMPTCSDVLIGDHEREWRGRLPIQPSRQLMERVLATDDDERRRQRFIELVRQVLSETVDDLPFANPALQRMLARLWSNLHRGVTVEDLINASGLSRAQAYRVFTEGYGVPPKDAILTARLWLVQGLMHSGLGMAAIAERCGFASTRNFTRAWRSRHGVLPDLPGKRQTAR